MRVSIGCDPGTSNYGYSIASYSKKKNRQLRVDLLEIGMFLSTVTNLTAKEVKPVKSKRKKTQPMVMEKPFSDQFEDYLLEWESMLSNYKPIKISAERFQTRGIKGKTIEAVSMMNGAVAALSNQKGIDYEIFIASSWKNVLNSSVPFKSKFGTRVDKKGRVLKPLEIIYIEVSIPPHIVDSVFINVHGLLNKYSLKWADVDIDYIFEQLKEFIYVK